MTFFTLSLSAGRGLTTPAPAARVLRDVDEPDLRALEMEPLSELSGSM